MATRILQNKRTNILHLLLFILLPFMQACSQPVKNQDQKPNMIIILTDDQGYNTIEYMPILQRELVAKGIQFTSAIATTPLCCPSRSSILTGQYAHTHGVLDNRLPLGGALRFEDSSTLAVWLHEAGYRTGLFGKYLNDYDGLNPAGYVPPGWDEWNAFYRATRPHRFFQDYSLSENGEIIHYDVESKNFSTDLLAERAVAFIKESKNQPFFLYYAPYAPHQPHEFAGRHNQLYRDDQAILDILPANFNEEDITDKPVWLQTLGPADREQAINTYQRTLRSLQAVDDAIGKMIEMLEKTGQRENTVIIFMADNGLTYGEHRLLGQKNCQFEECIRVPMIISYPEITNPARQESRLVSNIDIAPTLVDLAGLVVPESVEGASLLPLLMNNAENWRQEILFEHWRLVEGFGGSIPDFTGIRTAEWKYVEYDTGELELYHLVDDPFEMTNLSGLAAYSEIQASLRARLESLRMSTGYDPGLREKLMLEAQPEINPDPSKLPDE